MKQLDYIIGSHRLIKKMCNVDIVYIKIADNLWANSDSYVFIKNNYPDECLEIEKNIKDEQIR